MKKGVTIGIAISIISLAIIFGIGSLPDEVLIEDTSLESSQTLPTNEEPINVPVEKPVVEEPVTEPVVEEPVTEPVVEEPVTEPVVEEPVTEPVVEEPEYETSEDNVIKVEIRDGIGSGDK